MTGPAETVKNPGLAFKVHLRRKKNIHVRVYGKNKTRIYMLNPGYLTVSHFPVI
ncbi:hypothetical protein DCCM_0751 [Desulfocucumis palustris]|uniref:Uncharacterized protein n=1 Tax=Desulfocucumis palustris TaxID=1898651 RepID=A0A2L2X8P6_9FIRM|nr:hypothetical protein DCCM_0751 [Desulfocucumis palustris]